LRYDFHTGAVSTGATQDLFRCLSEQLHIARTEIPQKYALVVKLVLEAFTQYRHVQLKRVYARGVEQDVSMDRICSVANNLSRCVPLLDTLRDDIDIDLVGMDQDIVEDTLDDLGKWVGGVWGVGWLRGVYGCIDVDVDVDVSHVFYVFIFMFFIFMFFNIMFFIFRRRVWFDGFFGDTLFVPPSVPFLLFRHGASFGSSGHRTMAARRHAVARNLVDVGRFLS
jgi:hypothetical protein